MYKFVPKLALMLKNLWRTRYHIELLSTQKSVMIPFVCHCRESVDQIQKGVVEL